jgi:hypothetical protein
MISYHYFTKSSSFYCMRDVNQYSVFTFENASNENSN